MINYITNISKDSTLMLKEGKYEVKSGYSIQIGKSDMDSGVFEEVVNKGLATLGEGESLPAPMYEPPAVDFQKSWTTAGMDADAVNAYLANKILSGQVSAPAGKVTGFGSK